MDQSTLVTEQIEAGREMVRRFQEYAPVKAAFWLKPSDDDDWYLYLSSENVSVANTDLAFSEIFRITKEMENPNIDPFQIRVVPVDHPLVRAVISLYSTHPGRVFNRFNGIMIGGVSVDIIYAYLPPNRGVFARINFASVPGFQVCWAGPHPFLEGYCFGSKDGRLLFTEEDGKEKIAPFPASSTGSAINGFAAHGDYFAVSTSNDFCMWRVPGSMPGKIDRAAIPGATHSVAVTRTGRFIAPRGTQGLMLVDSATSERKTLVPGHEVDRTLEFQRVAVLNKLGGGELIASAVGAGGVAFIEFTNGIATSDIQTIGYSDWDVVDVCPLSSTTHHLAVAAVARDGTIGLFRDAVNDKRPYTMRFAGIEGEAIRLFSSRGHLLILTNKSLYLLGDVAAECLRGTLSKEKPTRVVGMPLNGIDANVYRDRSVLIVGRDHDVLRVDLSQFEQNLPKSFDATSIQQYTAILANPSFTKRGIEQETKTMQPI